MNALKCNGYLLRSAASVDGLFAQLSTYTIAHFVVAVRERFQNFAITFIDREPRHRFASALPPVATPTSPVTIYGENLFDKGIGERRITEQKKEQNGPRHTSGFACSWGKFKRKSKLW